MDEVFMKDFYNGPFYDSVSQVVSSKLQNILTVSLGNTLRDQVVYSFGKCIKVTIKGMYYG